MEWVESLIQGKGVLGGETLKTFLVLEDATWNTQANLNTQSLEETHQARGGLFKWRGVCVP